MRIFRSCRSLKSVREMPTEKFVPSASSIKLTQVRFVWLKKRVSKKSATLSTWAIKSHSLSAKTYFLDDTWPEVWSGKSPAQTIGGAMDERVTVGKLANVLHET